MAEVNGLMPDVPGDVPVSLNSVRAWRAVAFTAKNIKLSGGHSSRIADFADSLFPVIREGGRLVGGSFPMTCFTSDTGFMRLQGAGRVSGDRSGRVTFKATAYPRNRVVGPVHLANRGLERSLGRTLLARCRRIGMSCRIVTECVLQIPVRIDPAYKSDGLLSRPKGPVERNLDLVDFIPRTNLKIPVRTEEMKTVSCRSHEVGCGSELAGQGVVGRVRQGMRMFAPALRLELTPMACAALSCAYKAPAGVERLGGSRERRGQQRDYRGYIGCKP